MPRHLTSQLHAVALLLALSQQQAISEQDCIATSSSLVPMPSPDIQTGETDVSPSNSALVLLLLRLQSCSFAQKFACNSQGGVCF